MSLTYFKSLQTIDSCDQSYSRVQSQLNIVHSYLNIEEWTRKKTFAEVLEEKLDEAQRLKKKIMKFHNLDDHRDVVGFKCQVCHHIFEQPTALGGHMSKAHPNFKKQQSIRKQCRQKPRKSSIQKIKMQQYSQHQQVTRISKDLFEEIPWQY